MIFIKKMLSRVFIITSLLSHHMQAIDVRDGQGRTLLMNFVINKEAQILKDKKDLKTLWDVYFYKEYQHQGYMHTSNGIVAIYKYVPIRRLYTTDEDVKVYKQKEQDLADLINTTIKNIRIIAQSDIDINAQDFAGNTVQNYCYSEEIYHELRDLGANFQYLPWIYFHPTLGTVTTTGVVVGTLIMLGYAQAHYKNYLT